MRRPATRPAPMIVRPSDPLPEPDSLLIMDGPLAVGVDLSATRLEEAYGKGLFPWFGPREPVLWWSPDPRLVIRPEWFEPTRSLRKTLRRLQSSGSWRATVDRAFPEVMRACAAPRPGQPGTWIGAEIRAAYTELHQRGKAHSVEVWAEDELIGGLYGVALGRMFFGESMFARRADASKCAFAVLMSELTRQGVPMVDCQQETPHLMSLGARNVPRDEFLSELRGLCTAPSPAWPAGDVVWPVAFAGEGVAPVPVSIPSD